MHTGILKLENIYSEVIDVPEMSSMHFCQDHPQRVGYAKKDGKATLSG